jgi:16S rRNA (cytidine1402-2'-O)-methyltransferase
MAQGKLYIVATPIGNLGDITLRALETLKSVDFILCEDTRVAKKLLDRYEISKPTISYHHHSDAKKINEIKQMLADGKNLALVTDAGTPGISDPGNLLISSVIASEKRLPAFGGKQSLVGSERRGIATSSANWRTPRNDTQIVPVPGACAAVAALSVSGFPTDCYKFLGFPPHKNKRQKYFKEVAESEETVVFYESGHRIMKCLNDLKTFLPAKRQILVGREITKMFETFYRGTVDEIIQNMKDERGEFVVVVNAR